MKCPSCGNPDAYQGLMSLDCPNSSCRYFTKSAVITAPPPAPPQSNPSILKPGLPGAPGPGAPGPSGLTVTILSKIAKNNSIQISFKADGDPGHPNKTVEFQFTTPQSPVPQVCTLSNLAQYYVSGVNADNTTVYNTHWLCTNDGVSPNGPYTLIANIY